MIRAVFFSEVRSRLFGGRLTQPQVEGMEAILNEWEQRGLTDFRFLAYMLATTFHETSRTMQPIREAGRGRGKKYGTTYYGRGFVQLTWEANYRRAGKELKVDLVKFPDRALELKIAVDVMFDGMIQGWFTGKRLGTYIHGATCDYVSARRIINGMDRAQLIAGYAVKFENAIKTALTAVTVLEVPAVEFKPDHPTTIDPLPMPEDPSPKPAPSGLGGTSTVEGASKLFRKNDGV